jgi:WD40 repeat protein
LEKFMNNFREIQDAHLALLTRQDANATDSDLLRDAQSFIGEATAASTYVADPADRDLLRAYLRYWSSFVYERTGSYPKTELRPAETTALPVVEPAAPVYPTPAAPRGARRGFPWGILAGLVGLALLAAAILLVLPNLSQTPGEVVGPEPATPSITRTVPPPESLPFAPIDERNASGLTKAHSVNGHTGPALALAFDPRGGELASGGADGVARFWALPDLTLADDLTDQNGWVRTVAYSPAGVGIQSAPRTMANALPFLTGGNDRVVRIYERESLQLFTRFSEINGFIFSAVFSPDVRFVAAGGGDGSTHVWDAATGAQTLAIQARGTGAVVNAVAYSPDGTQLATGVTASGEEGGLQLWNASNGEWQCGISGASVTAVAYQPDGAILAAGTEAGEIFFIDPRRCAVLGSLTGHGGAVGGIAYSPAGDWLLSGGGDGTVKLWSADGQLLATPSEGGAAVEAVAVSPTAQFIAAGDANGVVSLWGVPR